MKKILLVVMILFLCGCNVSKKETNTNDRYFDMIKLIRENDKFASESNYFRISTDMAKIDNGYRFYVIVDNPRIAMYNIKVLAIEKDVDYKKTMAANIGIFEDNEFSMIPNQSNNAKNYVEGVVVSGTCVNPETDLYVLVQWSNKELTKNSREFFKVVARYDDGTKKEEVVEEGNE